ncbi:sulfotransferase [Mangrovimicrobium sediminis]|uniref:Sulfotransferase n=1 Tax=Mangrovimicrobium sediminis TaxID=2562682 RepID=A0A4Z0M3R2_9GAMM|nr:sulfotransferase [Haliea sp. SAOS-164]TGD74094.1 sulfotransferase [Haliea sp. SAOS-164]
MKKKLYLHIGMGKTGTTALQNFFWDNRKLLAQRDICYPELGSQSHAHHLLSPHIPRFLEGEWQFKRVDDWAPKLAESEQSRILLSSELMAWAEDAKARKFCAQLSVWFDVHMVIYLRRQDNIIMASYNQQIKAGPQRRRIDLIYRQKVERFDYPRILAPWTDSLSPGKVIVGPYEREQFYRGDIRRDFMHRVFALDLDDAFELSTGNSNPRLSLAAGEYKRMVNNLDKDGAKNARFNELLMRYSAEQDTDSTSYYSSQSVLSPQQRLEIIETTREASAKIARQYLGRADGKLFLEPEPQPDDLWNGIDLTREDADAITAYIRQHDSHLLHWLSRQVEEKKDHLAYQIRHSARFLAGSVLSSSEVPQVYKVSREDASPLVIGGLGGSGTRLVVSLLRRMGVVFGGELNESLDNLWFSLLFVRRAILLKSDDEMDKLAWLFANAMRHGVEVSSELRQMLIEACESERSPVLPRELREQSAASLLASPTIDRRHQHWGWKEPNSHILLPALDRCFPQMKYVYVVRNGLDMAFSENLNQLKYFWGDLLLEGDCEPTPVNALRYWVAAHKRVQGFRQRLGDRLHFLSFDRLCTDPEGELEALREFAGIQISKADLQDIAQTVKPPSTSGRFREHDLSIFDPADVAFVHEMGFEVE